MPQRSQSNYADLSMIGNNPDRWFAAKLTEHGKELASLFGPALTSFIGQYGKAHAPIGITGNKQAPSLMIVNYKAQLLNHDFNIAVKHKLTLTVIGLRECQDPPLADRRTNQHVGPTLI